VTVSVNANIHFGEDDVWHRFHPGDDNCHAYGALKFNEAATLYFDKPALVDKVIAELVALRAEMDPPAGDEDDEDGPCMKVGCGHGYDDHSLDLERGDRLYCQRCECRRYLSAEAMRVSA
jgi:hypothetical protein